MQASAGRYGKRQWRQRRQEEAAAAANALPGYERAMSRAAHALRRQHGGEPRGEPRHALRLRPGTPALRTRNTGHARAV